MKRRQINLCRQDAKKRTIGSTDGAAKQGVSVSIILMFQDKEVLGAEVSTSDEQTIKRGRRRCKHQSNFISGVNR
jgi:hypothetical protein